MAWENYGNAFVIDQRVALDASGNISLGLRGVVGRAAAGPATTRRATSSPASSLGFEPGAVRAHAAGAGAGDAAQQRLNTAPSYIAGRVRDRPLRRRRRRPQRARAVASRPVAVLHRTAARARAAAEHLRARVLHGRSGGAREGRPGRVPAAAPESRALSAAIRAAAKAANWEARPSPRRARARRHGHRPRHRLRALRGRQRLRRDGRRGRRRSGHRRSTSRGSSSRRTAVRSRIPTACATRSKAARSRVRRLASAARRYGAADFLGGLTSKRLSITLAIAVVSQLHPGSSCSLAARSIPPGRFCPTEWTSSGVPSRASPAALGSRCSTALAIGVMAVVAPTTAVRAVVIPLLVAVATGERPGVEPWGIVLAIIAIALVSQFDHPEPGCTSSEPRAPRHFSRPCCRRRDRALLRRARTHHDRGRVWPLVAARAVSVSLSPP